MLQISATHKNGCTKVDALSVQPPSMIKYEEECFIACSYQSSSATQFHQQSQKPQGIAVYLQTVLKILGLWV